MLRFIRFSDGQIYAVLGRTFRRFCRETMSVIPRVRQSKKERLRKRRLAAAAAS